MSQTLKINCKKVIFSLLAAGMAVSAMPPVYVKADPVAEAATGKASVKIKDTTLTFNNVMPAEKDSIGFLADITLERASDIPQETTRVFISGEGDVTINGKKYNIQLQGSNKFEKTSDTTAKIQVAVMPQIREGKVARVAKEVTPDLLKGKKMNMTIQSITYSGNKTTLSQKFKELLKNVSNQQGVEMKKAGFTYLALEYKGKVLPEKGLGIPVIEDTSTVVDNIGFVDGKLQIRTKNPRGEYCELELKDSTGKRIKPVFAGGESEKDKPGFNFIQVYDIKDAASLTKCTLAAQLTTNIAKDQETKTVSVTF